MTADQNGWQDEKEEEREALGLPDEDEAPWRGEVHPEGWPELLAGPEYWLYRRDAEQ